MPKPKPEEKIPLPDPKPWKVEISKQIDQFPTLEGALAYAKRLLDAGLWFIRLYKEDKKND